MVALYTMDYFVAIILGLVQGATEFIPISSSGHLIIARQLLGENNISGLSFDAVLQFATTLAVLVYFWRDIIKIFFIFLKILSRHIFFGARINRWCDFAQSRLPSCEVSQKDMNSTNLQKDETLFWVIIIGTIPAVIFGLFLESTMETIFRNVDLVALALILGSILFWFAQKISKQDKILSLGRGVVIGFFQCLALVPGISRSGATISGGLITGLTKEETIRLSFLLSVPILLGTGLKKLFEVRQDLLTTDLGLSLFLGSITAFMVGLLSINFLIKYLKNHSLNLFIWYRIGLVIAIFLLF